MANASSGLFFFQGMAGGNHHPVDALAQPGGEQAQVVLECL
jgi:hypothetical protein